MVESVTAEQVDGVQAAVRRVSGGNAAALVAAYYRPEPAQYGSQRNVLFAGRYFDELPTNDPEAFTVGDLAAASLLDVRFGPHVVLELLERSECNALLAKIPANVPLWEADDAIIGRSSPAWQLWDRLLGVHNVSRTRASKLLARKRPQLMPILDSVIDRELQLDGLDAWACLGAALTDEIRAQLDALAPVAIAQGAAEPSTLRLLDVITWMSGSQSEQAAAVRGTLDEG